MKFYTMNPRLNITDNQLAAFCRKWKIARVWLFGSVLRDDFRPGSDIDVMVQFAHDATWNLFDLSRMKFELQDLTGREVDMLTRRGVESSRNVYRRKSILESAEQVYAA